MPPRVFSICLYREVMRLQCFPPTQDAVRKVGVNTICLNNWRPFTTWLWKALLCGIIDVLHYACTSFFFCLVCRSLNILRVKKLRIQMHYWQGVVTILLWFVYYEYICQNWLSISIAINFQVSGNVHVKGSRYIFVRISFEYYNTYYSMNIWSILDVKWTMTEFNFYFTVACVCTCTVVPTVLSWMCICAYLCFHACAFECKKI